MDHPRILIDASNLVVGGGVQVGASVIDEILKMRTETEACKRWPWLETIRIEASPEVVRNATALNTNMCVVEVPRRSRIRRLVRRRGNYDVTFILFGPIYDAPRSKYTIMGFADGTSLYPELANAKRIAGHLFLWLRSHVSRWVFARTDLIVVEAPHTAAALEHRWNIGTSRVRIVPNVVNHVFANEPQHEQVVLADASVPTFAYPTRAYPHKNIEILGRAAEVYGELYGEDVLFALTLTEDEWGDLPEATRNCANNLGPLSVSQVPSLLRRCQGTIFPSLLESFSVTPLEALAVGSPLLASDRDFVRSVVGECAEYFNPVDPESVARAIHRVLTFPDIARSKASRGRALVADWPTASDRVERYLQLVQEGVEVTSSSRRT